MAKCMHEIPTDYFWEIRDLSYAYGSLQKFLTDIDIREKEPDYDLAFRKRLLDYVKTLEKHLSS